MAMFHFRLKSDKKPDGTKISAVQHVKYINRVDNFSSQNQHQENDQFVGNLISSAEIKNACDGLNTLLYKTDFFGSIRNSNQLLRLKEVGACPYPYRSLPDARFKRFHYLVGQTSSGG